MVRKFISKRKEIGYQRLALLGQDALGMELHALHRQPLVSQPHDDRRSVTVLCPRGDFQFFRQALLLDEQRIVARGRHWRWQSAENRAPIVPDLACLAVHPVPPPDGLSSKRSPDSLMSQANA